MSTSEESTKGENEMGMDLNGLASLVDTVRAGRGSFMGGGGGEGVSCGYGAYSGPTAIRADVLANRDIGNTGIENLQREFASITSRDQVGAGFDRVCETVANADQRNTDGQYRAEQRSADLADRVRIETKLDAVIAQGHAAEVSNGKQHSEIMAEVKAVESRSVAHDRDKAERKVERLELQNACGCGCRRNGHHGGHG